MDGNYYTDGRRLYEVAARRAVQNYGCRRGVIHYTILRDCVTEVVAHVDELYLIALEPVGVRP
jgi:hypothetical protein